MISSTLGAPFGGTMRGAHQAFDSEAFSLITPPNFGSGGGSCFPSMVVVAPGEPGTPVVCWAITGRVTGMTARATTKTVHIAAFSFMLGLILSLPPEQPKGSGFDSFCDLAIRSGCTPAPPRWAASGFAF